MVTGAAGLLGSRLAELLSQKYRVVAVIHQHEFPGEDSEDIQIVKCDLTDRASARSLVQDCEPNVIINSAAMTDVDACEEHHILANMLNCDVVAHMLDAIGDDEIRFVQISTDYLFDGRNGPYAEDAVPNPVNVYGRTKADAEQFVHEWKGESLIVRTSALYDSESHGSADIFATAYSRLQSGKVVRAASDLYCNPIWTVNLSDAIAEAINLGLSGIINIAGSEYLSRYDFATSVAREYGFRQKLIQAVPISSLNRKAVRPLKAGLDITRASKLLHTRLLTPSEAFADFGLHGRGKN